MKKENCNIQLAQRFNEDVFNKNFGKDYFYAVPNIIGRNILILKNKKTSTMMLPKYTIGIDEDKAFFVTDEKNPDLTSEITSDSIATKISAITKDGNRDFIDCSFNDLIPILSEINEFFMTDMGFQGKIVYSSEVDRFLFVIYDIFTLSEFENKQGITPYIDRRELLDRMNVYHTFVNISIAPTFYKGNRIIKSNSQFEMFNKMIIENVGYIGNSGYIIYKPDSEYVFGQTEEALIVS